MFFLVDTCSPSFHFRCHHVMSSMFWNLKKNITSYIFFTCEVSIEEAQEKSAGGVTLTLPGRITSVYLEYFGCSTGWIKTQDLLPFTSFHCNPRVFAEANWSLHFWPWSLSRRKETYPRGHRAREGFFLTSTAFLKNSTVDSVAIYGPFVAGDDSVHPWCTARGGCRWNPLEAYSNIVCAFPLKHIWIILLTFVDPFRLTGFAEMPVVPSALSAGGCGKGSTARIL